MSAVLRRRSVGRGAVLAVLAAAGGLLLAGCGGSATPAGAPTPDVSPSFVLVDPDGLVPEWLEEYEAALHDSLADPEAPEEFRERESFASCGAFILDQGAWDFEPPWECLYGAADTGGELILVRPTTEGDPVIDYYRMGPGIEGMDHFYDATRDTFGSGEWHYNP